nr:MULTISPECIES: tRNA lysidine(34) synthetase TilS [unclassified Ruminococcus]
MIGGSSNIVVAVSGGADSMCLLHFLFENKTELGINRLIAAHVNHNIRGDEAKRDELFVMNFCNRLGIEFELLDVDIPKLSKEYKTGTEETARRVRYEYFKTLSEKHSAVIATAHNANDNAETVIYNLARGSALKGLCGIPPKREYIIRPLIRCNRDEIERYCRSYSLEYVTDSTNLTDDYTRNKIRHGVLPVLKQINPSIEQCITRSGEMLKNDDTFLYNLADEALKNAKITDGYDLKRLQNLNISVLSRAVIILLSRNFDIKPDRETVTAVCSAITAASRVNIKNGVCADANSGVFRLYKITPKSNKSDINPIVVSDGVKAHIQGRTVEFNVLTKKEFNNNAKFNNLLFKNAIDYDIINDVTVMRTRRTGDIFSPKNRGWTKTLKKFLIDEKVISEKRDKLMLIAQDNEILWLEGFGVSRKARITSDTEKILTITFNQSSESKNNG